MIMPSEANAFAQRLAETIAWCSPRIDPAEPKWCLRSQELRPQVDYYSESDPTFWNTTENIKTLASLRSKYIDLPTVAHTADITGGRLLLCFFDCTNFNELTADETNWFFDGCDNPPWDTWVDVLGDALVSWVPSQFQSAVDHAIAIECCGMLMWLESPILGHSVDRADLEKLPRWLFDYSIHPHHEIH